MNLCRNCKFSRREPSLNYLGISGYRLPISDDYLCSKGFSEPVIGLAVENCSTLRHDSNYCGFEGKYFTPKEEPPLPF